MKTLVIHPDDRTTDFLCDVYKGKHWDVQRKALDGKILLYEAEKFDRIVMLGHGCAYGLFSVEGMNFTKKLFTGGLVVNADWSELLRTKDCIGIWCYASDFAKDHKLNGFYSNMWISELYEADFCGISTNQQEIDQSNYLFANAINRHAFKEDMYDKVMDEYISDTELIRYNRSRLAFYSKSLNQNASKVA